MSVSATTTTATTSEGYVKVPIVLQIRQVNESGCGRTKIFPPPGEVSTLFSLCAMKISEIIYTRKIEIECKAFEVCYPIKVQGDSQRKSLPEWYDDQVRQLPQPPRQRRFLPRNNPPARNNPVVPINGENYLQYHMRLYNNLKSAISLKSEPYNESFKAYKQTWEQRVPAFLLNAINVRVVEFTNLRKEKYLITMTGGDPQSNFQDLANEVNRLVGRVVFHPNSTLTAVLISHFLFEKTSKQFGLVPESLLSFFNDKQFLVKIDLNDNLLSQRRDFQITEYIRT